jgi:hypothetical protein
MWPTSLKYIKALIFVTREIYRDVAFVKQQYQESATQSITKLQSWFLAQDFMDALGNVYP